MSDYLAVGGVTAVLKWLLTSALPAGGPGIVLTSPTPVTSLSPDMITASMTEEPQVNVFMYYVSLNPALRNLDLPSADAAGNPVSNRPLALNLHYLVSAYGGTQLTAEILLGWALKVFHDNPVVPAQAIQDALTALASQASVEAKLVAGSTLAQQIEHIRITPEALTTEEIYRMWPAFQAPYRPSSAFQVSVVVIQDTAMVTSGPPVRERRLAALPLLSPVISGISPVMASAGQVLTITGANFLGQSVTDTSVTFDDATLVAPGMLRGDLLKVTLPASLQAGTRMARVQRAVTFPGEATPRTGFSSSPAPFQLLPAIQDASPIQATHGTPLTLTISPAVGRAQQVTVYIGDQAIGLPARPLSAPPASTTLTFTVPSTGITAASYPIRVEVDGASSALTQQPGGQWTPQVVVA